MPTSDTSRGPDAKRQVGWLIYLGIGVIAIGTYYLLPRSGVGQGVLLTAINVTAAMAAYRAAVGSRGQARVVWLALGAAMTMSSLANGPYYAYPLISGHHLPFPGPSDIFFLLMYPCFVVALVALAKQRSDKDRVGDALDTAIVIVGGAMLMWHFVIATIVHATGAPLMTHVVSISYPAMDLVVFAMLVRLVIGAPRRSGPMRLLLASIVALLVGDVVYALMLTNGKYAFGGPPDGLWMTTYLLIGVAALHPHARAFRASRPSRGHRVSRGRLAFLGAVVLTGPALMARHPRELEVLATVTALSFLLVMIRMTGLNRQLVSAGAELEIRASTDSLTGLANRAAFAARLDSGLGMSERRASAMGVVFLDLDDFKDVNDTLGHAGGDELLKLVATRFEEAVRPGDVVARLGGDEFAVLLEGVADAAIAVSVAERAVASLAAPFEIGGTWINVQASAGVAVCSDRSDPDSLMRQADVAMYAAKGHGKNRVECYDPAVHEAVVAHQALKGEVADAAGRAELVLDYQPVVALTTGEILGVEALVRWQHPVLGLLPPSAFIDLAETTGAIIGIGSWVLETAARQLADWQHRHCLPELWLSVNVSGRQLDQLGFAEHVAGVLRGTGLAPTTLVLEVTESVLVNPASDAAGCLGALRAHGIRVAIDDFGTGYSSISYLGELPVDILKIDRSFVSGVHTTQRGFVLLDVIVDLAKRLGLEVIPEGIETSDQLARVQSLQCRMGQGFLMSRPVPAIAIDALLAGSASLLPEGMGRARVSVPIG